VTTVLKNVSLQVRRGEAVAVVGPSGAGKTTLLYLLGGLARPTQGRVTLEGYDLYALADEPLARLRNLKVGFIFQFHHLLPELTALENAALPLWMGGASRAKAEGAARDLLTEVGLGSRLQHRPGELSGGEQQRVAIARALGAGPQLILADEPTGNLDKASAQSVHNLLLKASRQRGAALVMVTHNEVLAATAERIIKMEDGKIVS
jgi:lipoprotein-releasing system ATP-binding protein